jgi:HSP20 family protein
MLQLIPRRSSIFPARDLFDRFFDDVQVPTMFGEGGTWVPAFDISENDKEFVVSAEIPGIDSKDLEVTFSDGVLKVKGEKKREKEENGDNIHRVERYYGSFQRSFVVPVKVEEDKVEATYKDGVLTLTMPKAEKKEIKKIEISDN